MEHLISLLHSKESWLADRIFDYASRHGFAAYTSTLVETWRKSIVGLTEAISEGLSNPIGQETEITALSDWARAPVARFGLVEARKHRERGVELGMFLGLFIYYRQTYQDCVREFIPAGDGRDHMEHAVVRIFDRISLAFCSAWAQSGDEEARATMASTLLDMTSEKNRYLTFFEDLDHPAVIITSDGILENMNRAASLLLDPQTTRDQAFFGRRGMNESLRHRGLEAKAVFPWLAHFLEKFMTTAEPTLSETIRMPSSPKDRTFRATTYRGQPNASGKCDDFLVLLRDETERIEIRRQIVKAKEELERTFDTISDLVFTISPSGVILRANKALASKLGLRPKNLVGRTCKELLGCEECRFEGSSFRPQDLPIAFPNIPGSYLVQTNDLRTSDGEFVGRVVVARDVSATERIKSTLLAVENKYTNIIAHAPIGIYQSTLAGTFLSVNMALARMFGFKSPEDMLAYYTDIARQIYVHPEDRAAILAEAKANDAVMAREVELLRQDGTHFWCRLYGRFVRDADGKILHMQGFAEDVTAHRTMLLQLEENEKRFRSLAETMTQGLAQTDCAGVIKYCNDHLCALLGTRREALLGTPLADYVHPEDVAQCRAIFDQNICQLCHSQHDIRFISTGKTLFTLVSVFTLYHDMSCRAYWVLILDITERKMLESQLLQTQKLEAIGQLAAGIAHEINTPTQYVMNNMWFIKEGIDQLGQAFWAYRDFIDNHSRHPKESQELLALEARDEELQVSFYVKELPDAISETLQGLDRISGIVNSVKQFAHPGHNRQESVNLNELVANTVTLSRNEWKYVAEMSTDLDPELPPVRCVAQAVGQVLLNLVVNAAHAIMDVQHASGRNGHIAIATRKVSDWAEIRIQDTGSGIPVHVRNHLFEPFFTTKPVGKGTGQGLFIAYRTIVAEHGGTIDFETELGKGTTFIFTLPIGGRDHDADLV